MNISRIAHPYASGHALVTGGAGFIGSHLSEALLAHGYEVTVLDDLSTGRYENITHLAAEPAFRFVEGTVTDSSLVERLTRDADIVFHMAAVVGVELIVSDPVHVIETNVMGTQSVLSAAARLGRKVLIASTSEIYGKNERIPFREDDDRLLGPTTRSRWSYATSKAIDEFLGLAYHQKHGLPVVVSRFFNTVGPRQTGRYGMVVPRFVQQALKGESITVYGDGLQSRCFCDVADVVRAILGLAESPAAVGQVFNIGSGEEVTILDLARKVLTMTGTNGVSEDRIRFVPYSEAYQPGFEDMRRRVPDTSKIRRLTRWEPRISLEETLGRIIAYYQGRLEMDPGTALESVA
jgi:UDP-glucose 4-epimerase